MPCERSLNGQGRHLFIATHPFPEVCSRVLATLLKDFDRKDVQMNFTYTAFSKAARRLAETDDIKLSQAQEKLAVVLGFKNHHAAQQALQLGSSAFAPGVDDAGYVGRRWLGLTWMQTFEFLALSSGLESDDPWNMRALDLLHLVSADVFSRGISEPVTANELSSGLNIMTLMQRAQEIREEAKPEDIARHQALLVYVSGIWTGKGAKASCEPTDAAFEQHSYLTMQIAPALNKMFLLEASNATPDQALELYRLIKADSASLVEQIVVLEARARFSSPIRSAVSA